MERRKNTGKIADYLLLLVGISVLVLLLSTTVVYPAQKHDHSMVKAFSDPEKGLEMPEEWKNQVIHYEDWAEGADLVLSLDQHLYPAYKEIIEEYAEKNGLTIALKEGTCGISAGALKKKAADIAGFCCPPGETDRLPGLTYHTVGIGALTLLVHPDNPVKNITLAQAQEIYMGKTRKWSQVSTDWQEENAIHPVARLHCKQRPGHWRLLLDSEDQFGLNLTNVGSIQDIMIQASTDRYAIAGTETLYMQNHAYKQENNPRPLNIDGYSPHNTDHLISGGYPLYFTYSLTLWENATNANPEAEKLVEFLMKHIGMVDAKYGIIPASQLKKAGWKFKNNELVGAPE